MTDRGFLPVCEYFWNIQQPTAVVEGALIIFRVASRWWHTVQNSVNHSSTGSPNSYITNSVTPPVPQGLYQRRRLRCTQHAARRQVTATIAVVEDNWLETGLAFARSLQQIYIKDLLDMTVATLGIWVTLEKQRPCPSWDL